MVKGEVEAAPVLIIGVEPTKFRVPAPSIVCPTESYM
jgi:hypothetical protein